MQLNFQNYQGQDKLLCSPRLSTLEPFFIVSLILDSSLYFQAKGILRGSFKNKKLPPFPGINELIININAWGKLMQ